MTNFTPMIWRCEILTWPNFISPMSESRPSLTLVCQALLSGKSGQHWYVKSIMVIYIASKNRQPMAGLYQQPSQACLTNYLNVNAYKKSCLTAIVRKEIKMTNKSLSFFSYNPGMFSNIFALHLPVSNIHWIYYSAYDRNTDSKVPKEFLFIWSCIITEEMF